MLDGLGSRRIGGPEVTLSVVFSGRDPASGVWIGRDRWPGQSGPWRQDKGNRHVTDARLSQALFSPRRIAPIGASTDASRLTARAQVYLRRHGFTGDLFPVNPLADVVLRDKAYPTLRDVPGPIDFAYIQVNTQNVETAIQDCAVRDVPVVCVLADGFAEAGPDGVALQSRILATAREAGIRLLGPNSIGVINVPAAIACSVNAVLEAETLIPGR